MVGSKQASPPSTVWRATNTKNHEGVLRVEHPEQNT